MLYDLISTSSYGMYNIPLAHKLGLSASIYLNLLLDVNNKAIKKAKDSKGFFCVDRSYVYQRTTITPEQQEKLEETLIGVMLLERGEDSPSHIKVNVDVLVAMMSDDSEALEKAVARIATFKTTKRTKKQIMVDKIKEHIMCSNPELRQAYSDWVDAVVAKLGWMSVKSMEDAQNLIDSYSNRYLDIALGVLNIAIQNGWRDMAYAIEKHKKDNTSASKVVFTPTPLVEERKDVSGEVF